MLVAVVAATTIDRIVVGGGTTVRTVDRDGTISNGARSVRRQRLRERL
jgi:hypothetical protein